MRLYSGARQEARAYVATADYESGATLLTKLSGTETDTAHFALLPLQAALRNAHA